MFWERIKKFFLLGGDLFCFYLALVLVFRTRFPQGSLDSFFFKIHLKAFSLLFLFWLLVFYIAHFYELKEAGDKKKILKLLPLLQLVNFILGIILFYFYPIITPKTNLFLVVLFSLIFLSIWRWLFASWLIKKPYLKIAFYGDNQEIEELVNYLNNNPQLGYRVVGQFRNYEESFSSSIDLLIVPKLLTQEFSKKVIPSFFLKKIELRDLSDFYEEVFKKIPLFAIEENWFLINFKNFRKEFFQLIKRIFDVIFALFWLGISSPFWPIIILLIKLDSPGPIFYIHERVGEGGKIFKIIKFRTMVANAKEIGPHWTEKGDKRITSFGKFLRKTHLDELPQLINILKGEMSFVGPRPEEKELVEIYIQKIPFYQLRHLVKPGIVGWAQLNYPHGASVEDAIQKLQYDFYYLKHRSFWLDLSIILRTLRILLTQPTH